MLDSPVPPLATFKVPERVTAPAVPLLGENPVVPALKLVTPEPTSAPITFERVATESIKVVSPFMNFIIVRLFIVGN